MLLGTYAARATPWSVNGTPRDFGHELLEPKLDNIADRLALGFERIPALEKAGIKNIINGPFTFGPDGNPMIGPVPGMKNYWVAVGVMAGFCQGSCAMWSPSAVFLSKDLKVEVSGIRRSLPRINSKTNCFRSWRSPFMSKRSLYKISLS